MITPNSVVRLIKGVPVSPKHQPTFATVMEQANFFASKSIYSFTDFTYIRESGYIKVPASSDLLYSCNYLMYQNTNYTGKWFYAYITGVEYLNDETCKVFFEQDPYQSWLFEHTHNKAMIEREHCKRYNADGTPVINTVDEGLDIGDGYAILDETNLTPSGSKGLRFAVITATMPLTNHDTLDTGGIVAGAINTLFTYVVPVSLDYVLTPKLNGHPMWDLPRILSEIQKDPDKTNAITSVSIVEHLPYSNTVTVSDNRYNVTMSNVQVHTINNTSGVMVGILLPQLTPINKTLSYGNKYGKFVKPTESKLLMHPYSYIEMVDYKGGSLQIKMEEVSGTNLDVVAYGSCGHIPYTVYAVNNYNGLNASYNHCIIDECNNSLPVLNDHTATYIQANMNQLRTAKENAGNVLDLQTRKADYDMTMGVVTGLTGVATGVATGNVLAGVAGVGAMIGGASNAYWTKENANLTYDANIKNMMAQYKDIQRIPPNIASQGNAPAYNMSHDINGVYLQARQIKPEYMQRLSDYFMMFGYAVRSVKLPNLKTRQAYNYIKTMNCSLKGDLPQSDRLMIENMFNNGVTLWHNPDRIGDYTQTNNER